MLQPSAWNASFINACLLLLEVWAAICCLLLRCCSLLSFWPLWSSQVPSACRCIITKLFQRCRSIYIVHLSSNLEQKICSTRVFRGKFVVNEAIRVIVSDNAHTHLTPYRSASCMRVHVSVWSFWRHCIGVMQYKVVWCCTSCGWGNCVL